MTGLTFERLEPDAAAVAGSRVLLECWKPPCLHYSPEYLRWHLRFPASIPPVAIAALDGPEPVGFIGATPRTVSYETGVFDIYLVSFVGVRPAWQGRGIAASLYRELLNQQELRSNPIITFAEPGSAGEKLIKTQYPAAGLELNEIGRYAGAGFIARAGSNPPESIVAEMQDVKHFSSLWGRGGKKKFIDYCPTTDQLGYYLHHSSPRKILSVVASNGRETGAAINTCAEVVSGQGIASAVVLESITLLNDDVDALSRLCAFAASEFQCGPVVSIPNPPDFDSALMRSRGFRNTGRAYDGFVATANPKHPLLHAFGTNLEIT